jgi:hypothetical protein
LHSQRTRYGEEEGTDQFERVLKRHRFKGCE